VALFKFSQIVKGILACIKLGSIGRSTRGSNYPLLVLDSVHNGVKFYPIVTKTFLAELKALTEVPRQLISPQ
jgi:hypothetical protein